MPPILEELTNSRHQALLTILITISALITKSHGTLTEKCPSNPSHATAHFEKILHQLGIAGGVRTDSHVGFCRTCFEVTGFTTHSHAVSAH